jgi:glycosyltransferase involved in cell wall biosynthesis
MIVKDESKVIRRVLESVKPYIDHWVICDTGSTDDTKELIKEIMKDIPGELYESEWVDFGTNRSISLKMARGKADYFLIIDADCELQVIDPDWKNKLTADAYNLPLTKVDDGATIWTTRLVKATHNWRYEGVVHEYIICDTLAKGSKAEPFELIRFLDHIDGGHHADLYSHIRTLIKALTQIKPTDKLKPRYTFYLAQSYYGVGEKETALYWYQQRAKMVEGYGEEQWFAFIMIGEILKELGRDASESIAKGTLPAIGARPHRLEAYYDAIKYFRETEQFESGYQLGLAYLQKNAPADYLQVSWKPDSKGDLLFVVQDVYDWGFAFEFGICAAQMGDAERSLYFLSKAGLSVTAPADIVSSAQELVQMIQNNIVANGPDVYGGT